MNFLSIASKYTNIKSSKVVILKIPYELTTSYGKGCKYGPDAIIKASGYVELFDEELKCKPHTLGISTQAFSQFKDDHTFNLNLIGDKYIDYYNKGKFVIAIGGEHSITIGIVSSLVKTVNNLSVVSFDAHADMRNYYRKSKYSHACVMRRVYEHTNKISLIGTRSYSESENSFLKKNNIKPIHSRDVIEKDVSKIVKRILQTTSNNIYITFDVDFFSQDIIRSTGTPEPGGPGWYKTLDILSELFKKRNIVGMDFVELIGDNNVDYSACAFSVALLIKKCIVYEFSHCFSKNQ